MAYTLEFDTAVKKTIAKWKKSNPSIFKKLNKVLHDIMQHPREGMGHPEPLVGGRDILYSRRITAHDRIVYEVYDDKIFVLVIKIEGHYSDK